MTASTHPPSAALSRAVQPVASPVRRRGRRWLAGLPVTALALAAAWVWMVPPLVEARLLAQFGQSGFGEVRIGSIQVGFGHVTVREVTLGSAEPDTGTLTIATATAEFTWSDLLDQCIDSLVLDEPLWTMSAMPGRALSPFDGLRQSASATATPNPTHPLPELPVREFLLRGGRIVPPPGSAVETVKVDARLTANGAQWDLAATAEVDKQVVRAVAQLRGGPQHAAGNVVVCVLGPQPIELEGTARLGLEADGRQLVSEMRRRPGPFEVTLAGTTWSGDGDLALDANVPFAHLDAATLAVRLADFRLSSTNGLQWNGLESDVHLQGLPMPVSTSPQQVRWQSAQFASIKAGSGNAQFTLHSGAELRVQGRQKAIDEIGSIAVSEVRLAPGVRSFPTTVAFDQVSLQEWLELLSGGRVTGEGRVSGSVMLAVQTDPRLSIELQGGRLAATPGGVVRFLDDAETEGLIRQYVQQIAMSTGHDAVVQDRLVAALREFAYTALDFRIEPDAEAEGRGVTLRVHAAGEGRKVPQEVNLDVNLHGFDTAVDTAIAIKFGLDRAKRLIADKINHQPPRTPVPR